MWWIHSIVQVILLAGLIWGHIYFAKKLLKEVKQQNANYQLWHALCIIGGLFPLFSMAIIYLFYAIIEGRNSKETFKGTNIFNNNVVSDICPHCKNPNTKKLQECE